MALTASELLQQRLDQDKSDLQTAFSQEWSIVNRRFGPQTSNMQIEAARQQALSSLHQRYAVKAQSLLGDYDTKFRGLSEIDAMAENGMISANPEEVKLRSLLPTDVERATFPKEEDASDPLEEYGRFSTQLNRVRDSLKRFEREAPGQHRAPVAGTFKRGSVESMGGGVLVVEEEYDENKDNGKGRPRGGTVAVRRNATPAELREWAELTEHERQLQEAMAGIRNSEPMAARIRLAAVRSRRMGNAGTFAEKATQTSIGKQTFKRLDTETALALYEEAGGDPVKARELARQRGYRY